MTDFNDLDIWDLYSEDFSMDDLAVDKRAALQKILDQQNYEYQQNLNNGNIDKQNFIPMGRVARRKL